MIIDEIGYLPIVRTESNVFFQLITWHYEKGPMILTSNQRFRAWGEIFGDRRLAITILDRALHHGITINIRSHSYRLKEKVKAGLMRMEEASPVDGFKFHVQRVKNGAGAHRLPGASQS